MRIPSGTTDQYIYFVAVNATDFTSREPGLTGFTVYYSKNGAATATQISTPTVTEITNMTGVYALLLNAGTTLDSGNDSEELVIEITKTGMAPVTRTIELYRPKITVGNTLGVASDGDLLEVNTVTGHTAQTGDSYARIGAAGAGLTAVPWNTAWAAPINAEVDSALETYGLDHLVSASVAGADVANNSIVARLVSKSATADWDTYDQTTDSLEAIRDNGDAAWTTGAGGTPPQLLQSTTITGLSSQTVFQLVAGSADDDAYNGAIAVITDSVTATQKCYATIDDYIGSSKQVTLSADPGIFPIANGDTIVIMTPLGAAGSAPTAGQVADAVWTEAIGDHSGTVGSTAEALADILTDTSVIGAAGAGLTAVPWNSAWATQVTNAVWDASTTGHTTGGTFGQQVKTDIDAILVDTGTTIPAQISGLNDLDAAGVRTAVGLASANLDTQLAAVPTATENADTLLNRNMAVVSDTTARSPLNALRAIRNRVDVTTGIVYKEDDSTTAWTTTLTTSAGANLIIESDPD